MMKKKSMLGFFLLFFTQLVFSWPFSWMPSVNKLPLTNPAWLSTELSLLKSQAVNIDNNVLRLSLEAYSRARQSGLDKKQLLTVIDYSKPSTEKRLWVFDLKNNRTLFNTWVSHGKNSGGINATSFSNASGSLKSSLGVFVTSETDRKSVV